MAVSCPDAPTRRRVVPLVLLLGCALVPAAAQQQEILLEATSSDFDRRNERLVFQEVRIQQGELMVMADEAESRDLDFSRGSWEFRGNVRITGPMGEIEAATATIGFADHQLTRATAQGTPALFARTMPEPDARRVTGTANRIDYDLGRGELELAGQAALRDGIREVSGGRLLYRISEDRLIASADEDGRDRVRIVISPPGEDGQAPRQEPERDDDPELQGP